MIFENNQFYFNQIKGTIQEMIEEDKFCSITLQVGHSNSRLVNLSCKKEYFDTIIKSISINDKVICQFYVSSNQKFGRWYNTISLLSCEKQAN
jgi:hypothetical protein